MRHAGVVPDVAAREREQPHERPDRRREDDAVRHAREPERRLGRVELRGPERDDDGEPSRAHGPERLRERARRPPLPAATRSRLDDDEAPGRSDRARRLDVFRAGSDRGLPRGRRADEPRRDERTEHPIRRVHPRGGAGRCYGSSDGPDATDERTAIVRAERDDGEVAGELVRLARLEVAEQLVPEEPRRRGGAARRARDREPLERWPTELEGPVGGEARERRKREHEIAERSQVDGQGSGRRALRLGGKVCYCPRLHGLPVPGVGACGGAFYDTAAEVAKGGRDPKKGGFSPWRLK